MNLIICPEMKRDINKYSGFFNASSRFAKKDLKGLFFTLENKKYLNKELYQLITCLKYIEDNLPDDSIDDIPKSLGTHDSPIYGYNNKSRYMSKSKRIMNAFIKNKLMLDKVMFGLIEAQQMPFQEDLGTLSPVQQLHSVNMDFLVKTSRDLIQSPQNLIYSFNNVNPDTGVNEDAIEYDYTAESYSDGVWKPEMLFLNSHRNKKNPNWVNLEVNIYSDPDAQGVGHKYNDQIYNRGTQDYYKSKFAYDGTPKGSSKCGKGAKGYNQNVYLGNSQDKYKNQGCSFGQFPLFQTSVNKRFYDRTDTGGYRDGGIDDRRVQKPHGYNMESLLKKSSY